MLADGWAAADFYFGNLVGGDRGVLSYGVSVAATGSQRRGDGSASAFRKITPGIRRTPRWRAARTILKLLANLKLLAKAVCRRYQCWPLSQALAWESKCDSQHNECREKKL